VELVPPLGDERGEVNNVGLRRRKISPHSGAGDGAGSSRDRGAAALEFALIAPILVLLIAGIVEFGFVFQAQLALTHGAREGARMAAVGKYDAAVVINRASPVSPIVITTVPSPPSAATSGQAITITLTNNYRWTVLPFPGTVQLRGQATMRRE
jgi:hypothetical protein